MKNNRIDAVIGIDIGGTNIRIGLVDNDLTCHHIIKKATTSVGSDLLSFVAEYYQAHKIAFNMIAVSIGFPGIVDQKTKEIIEIPNAKYLESKETIPSIEKALGIPVFVDKDVHHLITYDRYYHKLEHVENILGFYIGTGFGFGIYLNSRIFYGDQRYAGELGHIPAFLDEHGNVVGLENRTAGNYLKQVALNDLNDANIDDLFVVHLNHPKVVEVITRLSKAIASVLITLNVSHIILGGGIIHMKGFPLDTLKAEVKQYIKNKEVKDALSFYVQPSSDDAGIIGAYLLAKEKMNRK